MKSLSPSLLTVALFVAGVAAQDFMINTPNPPTQCVPIRFNWVGGQPPFFLAIIPGGQPSAPALQQFPGLTGNEFTWPANLPAGTSIGLSLTDANGQVAQSAAVTIQSGPNSDCLNSQSSVSPSGGSTPSGSGSGSGSTPTTTTTSSTSGGSPTSGSGTTRPPTPSSSTSSTTVSPTGAASGNGALSNVASLGLVGVLGAVAAALLA